jgi:hypothetical protein
VSALGVWGTPLEVACRAADLVVALPTQYLLTKIFESDHTDSVYGKTLLVVRAAFITLRASPVTSPYITLPQLQGETHIWLWLAGLVCCMGTSQERQLLVAACTAPAR